MGLCQTLLPILTNPLTYITVAGAGIAAAAAYSYSTYNFLPSTAKLYGVLRIGGSLSSILNFLWRNNVLLALAIITTFSNTIKSLLSGSYNGSADLALIALTEVWNKMALTVKQLVEGLGFLGQWIGQESGEVCTYLGSLDLVVSALASFWIAAAAYIFAIRLYDWIWGKGMTRDIDWPEVMLVVSVVTLISITVYGTSIMVEGLVNGMDIFQGLQNMTETSLNSSNTSNLSVNNTANVSK